MKQKLDKLKKRIIPNKKIALFLIGILLTGFIAGSLFVILLNQKDLSLVKESIKGFFQTIQTSSYSSSHMFFDSIIENLFFVILIWILGISVIGIPFPLFFLFFKSFLSGFTITAIITVYGIKGSLFGFFTLFPHQLVSLFVYLFLITYSVKLSFQIVYAVTKKKTIDFKTVMKSYPKILFTSTIGILFASFLEAYFMPFLLGSFFSIL